MEVVAEIFAALVLFIVVLLSLDIYMYPVCPKCHHNLGARRISRKKFSCKHHGIFNRERTRNAL